jgi:hypothetical protein
MKPADKDYFIGNAGPQGLRADPDNPTVGVPYHPTDAVEAARLRDRLDVLAGHETTLNGKNQHDTMKDTINSDYYKQHNDYWQKSKLQDIHERFMWAARRQLQHEDAGLNDRVHQRTADQRSEFRGPPTTTLGAP